MRRNAAKRPPGVVAPVIAGWLVVVFLSVR